MIEAKKKISDGIPKDGKGFVSIINLTIVKTTVKP